MPGCSVAADCDACDLMKDHGKCPALMGKPQLLVMNWNKQRYRLVPR